MLPTTTPTSGRSKLKDKDAVRLVLNTELWGANGARRKQRHQCERKRAERHAPWYGGATWSCRPGLPTAQVSYQGLRAAFRHVGEKLTLSGLLRIPHTEFPRYLLRCQALTIAGIMLHFLQKGGENHCQCR